MTDAPQGSLLERLEKGRFEHAVFLTYCLDVPFFEASVARHLLRRGCSNIVVFADARHLTAELLRLADLGAMTGRPRWWLGRHYSVIPIHHTSAFHPKLTLLIGEEIEAIIGSGNLEAGGLRSNIEIFHHVRCDREGSDDGEARALATQVWDYIAHRVAMHTPTFVSEQLSRVEDSVPWIRSVEMGSTNSRLVVGPGTDVVAAIEEMIGHERVDTLTILSPFFDGDLRALRRLIGQLRPERTVVLVQPETVSLPGRVLQSITGVEVYRMDVPASRYAHAKVVIAEGPLRSVLLAGSHNVSEPAFGGDNFEVSLLRVSSGDLRFSKALGLANQIDPSRRIDPSGTTLAIRPQWTDAPAEGNQWVIAGQLDGDVIEVVVRRQLSDRSHLVPHEGHRTLTPLTAVPVVEENLLRFRIPDPAAAAAWTAISIQDGEVRTAPAPLLHVEKLHSLASARRQGLPHPRIPAIGIDLAEVADILQDFGRLLMRAPDTRKSTLSREVSAKNVQNETSVQQLTYEDFVIPWKPEPVGMGAGSPTRSGLELVIAAVVRSVGGSRRPVDQPLELEEQLAEDGASLADRSLYAEEALAGGRIERDLKEVRELEFVPDREQVAGRSEGNSSVVEGKARAIARLRPPVSERARMDSARRIASRLAVFAKTFPRYIEQRYAEEELPIELIETITTAGRLVTAMVGRTVKATGRNVELLRWKVWSDFQVALLDVVTSERTHLLRRLPWARMRLELHRRSVEALVGYLAAVGALSGLPWVDGPARVRIQVGILRASRMLGIYDGRLRESVILEAAEAVLDFLEPRLDPPAINWSTWVSFVRKIREKDEELRKCFTEGREIDISGIGLTDPAMGDWVWWPHVGHHVAGVVQVDQSAVLIAAEPCDTKRVVPTYLIRIGRGEYALPIGSSIG